MLSSRVAIAITIVKRVNESCDRRLSSCSCTVLVALCIYRTTEQEVHEYKKCWNLNRSRLPQHFPNKNWYKHNITSALKNMTDGNCGSERARSAKAADGGMFGSSCVMRTTCCQWPTERCCPSCPLSSFWAMPDLATGPRGPRRRPIDRPSFIWGGRRRASVYTRPRLGFRSSESDTATFLAASAAAAAAVV